MDSIKALFTAVGSVTGGRNGHGEAEDHSVSVNLSVPKAMGGPGRSNTTTPEHLFAVGYAACFGGALDFVAVQKKKNAKGATVTCSVSIGPRDAGGFGIAVKLHVKDATLPRKSVPTRTLRGTMFRSNSLSRAGSRQSLRSSAAIVR